MIEFIIIRLSLSYSLSSRLSELYLQPYENYYGYADYASGQMWIAHILANRMLAAADGRQIDGHRLRGGVLITNTGPVRSDFLRSNLNEEHFGDQFHVYGLVWTPEQILLTVDGFQYGALRTNFRQHAQQHNLTQANLWSADAPLAPFDREVSRLDRTQSFIWS